MNLLKVTTSTGYSLINERNVSNLTYQWNLLAAQQSRRGQRLFTVGLILYSPKALTKSLLKNAVYSHQNRLERLT